MIHKGIEYVTLQNIDYYRPVMLTESGLDLHDEHPEWRNQKFYLSSISGYGRNDPWHAIEYISREGFLCGCRIGDDLLSGTYDDMSSIIDGKIYDLYYPQLYNIDNILENLDKLSLKL